MGDSTHPAPEARTAEHDEPLHALLRQYAYRLACMPHPSQPLTDDQFADIIAAAHLFARASARLEATEERLARHKAADRRRALATIAALIVFVVAWLVFCAVGITLDATH